MGAGLVPPLTLRGLPGYPQPPSLSQELVQGLGDLVLSSTAPHRPAPSPGQFVGAPSGRSCSWDSTGSMLKKLTTAAALTKAGGSRGGLSRQQGLGRALQAGGATGS